MSDMGGLVDRYWAWLKDNTHVRPLDDWYEITTPYLDRHNDFVQIYAKNENGKYKLTDDGYTIMDLESSGCSLDTPKRQRLLETTVRGFGVKLEDKALVTHASERHFPLNKHNLIQAILAVNDLFYVARPHIRSLFFEDVQSWLDLNDVRYSPNVKFSGRSGFDHVFDFLVPKSSKMPERLMKAVTKPDKDTAQSVILAWVDTRDTRPQNAKALALLNDREASVPASIIDALSNYDISAILWSDRDQAVELLTA